MKKLKNTIPAEKVFEYTAKDKNGKDVVLKFKVKQYLTYAEKKFLVDSIIQSSFVFNSNNVEYCDDLLFDVFTVFYVLRLCTNIKLPTYKDGEEEIYDIATTYDYAKGSGLWDFVIKECIPKEEYDFIELILREAKWNKEVEVSERHDIKLSIAKFINELTTKIPEDGFKSLIEDTIKELKNPKTIDAIKNIFTINKWNMGESNDE